MTTMTEPTTSTLDVPGAVLTYDVRQVDSQHLPRAAPDRIADGRRRVRDARWALHRSHRRDLRPAGRRAQHEGRSGQPSPRPSSTPTTCIGSSPSSTPGPVDLFASSGGAVNALALVAKHPEQVRTLVAHEPPLASILPDREGAMALTQAIRDTYQRSGFGAGMAQFIAAVSHEGPITPGVSPAQPAPDPAMFGLPTEDDGNRTDPLLGQNIVTVHALRAGLRGACGRRRPGS